MSELKEECGIFGVYQHPDSVNLTLLGLYSLQHRGQESVGIAYNNIENKLKHLKAMSLVSEFVKNIDLVKNKGNFCIGHIRYSTMGSSSNLNTQPLLIDCYKGLIGLAHNGNLINAKELRDKLRQEGAIFQTTVDSEVILHIMARSKKKSIKESLIEALNIIKGGFSILIITRDGIFAARDTMGNRPLWLGKLRNSYVFSSEDCALKIINARPVREVRPGELILIDKKGVHSINYSKKINPHHCVFELIYFARPDSNIFGYAVNEFREKCGQQLAKESGVDADLVMAVPDSGNYAALGYSKESGIQYEIGMVRNHYIGRTFIQKSQVLRENDVKIKLMPVANLIKNKRIIVVDDSIVRGTTSKKIIQILKEAGAREIHYRIASPPYAYPCYYGIDTPDQKSFIIHNHTVKQIQKYLNVTSLAYLSYQGLNKILGQQSGHFCYACFTGKYPIKPQIELKKEILEN